MCPAPNSQEETIGVETKPLQEQTTHYNTIKLKPNWTMISQALAELSRLELSTPLSRAHSRSFRA